MAETAKKAPKVASPRTGAQKEPGRRERKKAATRKALSDAALELFLEHGFEKVTVAQIAERADTAVTTLFAHFPGGKEALVLGDDVEREASLTAAVRERGEGESVLDALHRFFEGRGIFAADLDNEYRKRVEFVAATPRLRAHARQLWVACEESLAKVMAEETGRPEGDLSLRVLARYVLETPDLASLEPDPRRALDTVFEHLRRGWPEV
ncbi:TetR/AcrR family transcriptional regulator [Streptomyces indicus]|uniref:DNA-binding transcriptional regulator, AcrR family n=1 Tax=Streptomyces indicus TaxID=417292 RepID=A0A1G9BXM5_9ACTN|nr:TetR/AcrR family transcriptional regulator [Streptomyces indicus]SDK44113.1 DNA-binding transcriptional regulator, AcrR family [Streptomyces indicus]